MIVVIAFALDIIDVIRLHLNKSYMKTYDLRGKKTIITNTLFYMIMNSILQLLFITIGILMIAVLYKTIELDEPILTIFALLRAVIYFSGHGSISVSYYQL